MKKTLVALAAVAATSAFAQSSVTLYGLFDIAYGTTKSQILGASNNSRKTTGLMEGTTAGNRIGFRGTEDLGGGMKAGFVVETAFSAITTDIFGNRESTSGATDTNITGSAGGAYLGNPGWSTGGSSQNRQSYVSLSGSYGEVRAGYQYTNLYVLSSLSGYLGGFEGQSGADVAHTFAPNVGGARANGLTYISPNFSGFNVHVQYGSTTNPAIKTDTSGGAVSNGGATSKQARTGILVNYANGPFKASVAHTRMSGLTTTPSLTQLGASYDFGIARVMGTYNDGDNDAGLDYKSWQVGVNVPFGAFNVFGTVGKSNYSSVQSVSCWGGTCSVEDIKQRQFGVTYTLSKRTMLYASTGTTKGVAPSTSDKKGTDTRFGVRHTF